MSIAEALGSNRVYLLPQRVRTPLEWRVGVDVGRFDGAHAGHMKIVAPHRVQADEDDGRAVGHLPHGHRRGGLIRVLPTATGHQDHQDGRDKIFEMGRVQMTGLSRLKMAESLAQAGAEWAI